jgi:hypothetical protein
VIAIVAMVVVVAVPLTTSSIKIGRASVQESTVSSVVNSWAGAHGWTVASIDSATEGFVVRVVGPPPEPETASLETALDGAGLGDVPVQLQLVPETQVTLNPTR